ncbi:MFS transporter [Actinoplanes sp. TBRC 11911]|uniref:MFS transporter n=1 Tax=Actinoplanes sp. TBRC 11911 TaxID=2729386 RepID=UPI00145DC7A2|nr:MFS transporter [Actinoplanes sp. TBRC 11911]NMO54090.1 MFS transporter [Actinoplanes sp. TBRC 11911]
MTVTSDVRASKSTSPAFAVVVLIGTFMASLDVFIVNVSLPSISSNLGAGPSELEWIVAGYALPYGVGLLAGARLGDQFGRRRLFLWGISGFTLASAACGFAPAPGLLIGARAVQGLAAAALTPQVIASLTTVYTGNARARAVDAYAFTLGIAGVLGQLIGGALLRLNIADSSWRACFLVNIPVGAAIVLVGRRYLVAIPTHRNRFDPVGAGLLGAGLFLVILPLVEGHSQGSPPWTWVCLAVSPIVIAFFVRYERRFSRRGGSPMIEMALFRERAFATGIGVQLVFWIGQGALYFVLALYCQDGLELEPIKAGLVILPAGVGYMLTATISRQLAARFGKQVLAGGSLVMIIAQAALLTLQSHASHGDPWLLCAPLFVNGLGTGLLVAPLVSTVMAGVDTRHIGSAAGVLNTGVQVGTAGGVALIGILFYRELHGDSANDAVRHAFVHVIPYLIGLAALVALLAQLLPGREPASARSS